jgi:hypothetical protein
MFSLFGGRSEMGGFFYCFMFGKSVAYRQIKNPAKSAGLMVIVLLSDLLKYSLVTVTLSILVLWVVVPLVVVLLLLFST